MSENTTVIILKKRNPFNHVINSFIRFIVGLYTCLLIFKDIHIIFLLLIIDLCLSSSTKLYLIFLLRIILLLCSFFKIEKHCLAISVSRYLLIANMVFFFNLESINSALCLKICIRVELIIIITR